MSAYYSSYVENANVPPFYLVVNDAQEICWLGFGKNKATLHKEAVEDLKIKDIRATDLKIVADKICQNIEKGNYKALKLHIEGTPFQKSVWDALLKIPTGKTVSYQDIANDIGNPKAVRAVGSAVGANLISLIIPCHRVVKSDGTIHNYRWGVETKKKLLQLEKAIS